MVVLARTTRFDEYTTPILSKFSGVLLDKRYCKDKVASTNYNNPVNYVYSTYNVQVDDLSYFEQEEYNHDYVILVNELFNNFGLQKTKLQQRYGDGCIRMLYDLVRSKTNAPIFIADCRPRKLQTWRHIVQYIKKYDMKDVGLGMQYHVDLRTSQASKIVEAGTLALVDSIRRGSGLPMAITEITVWRSGASIECMRDAYQRIIDYSNKEAVFGLLWSVFQKDEWHWNALRSKTDKECSLYDEFYQPRFKFTV